MGDPGQTTERYTVPTRRDGETARQARQARQTGLGQPSLLLTITRSYQLPCSCWRMRAAGHIPDAANAPHGRFRPSRHPTTLLLYCSAALLLCCSTALLLCYLHTSTPRQLHRPLHPLPPPCFLLALTSPTRSWPALSPYGTR